MASKEGKQYKFQLGEELEDFVTGFRGITVCRMDHISGCDSYVLQPEGLTKEGKLFDSKNIDVTRLKSTGRIKTIGTPEEVEESKKRGGPRDEYQEPER